MDYTRNIWLVMVLFCFLVSCNRNTSIDRKAPVDQMTAVDRAKIETTIKTYFDGWMTGDTTKLGTAMHATCQLKNIRADSVVIFDRATYLSFFKPRPPREGASGKILSIDITDDIAAAKCQLKTKERIFTDYFNMMKLDENWYIVDKIATNKARPQSEN